MQRHQTARDCQPQPDSTVAGICVSERHKRFKYGLLLGWRNPDTGILYPDVHIGRFGLCPQHNRTVGGKLRCISKQVKENLAHPCRIDVDDRQRIGDVDVPCQTRFGQRGHQLGEQLSHEFIDVCLFGEQEQFVDFGTGYI